MSSSIMWLIFICLSSAHRCTEPKPPRVLRGALQHLGARVHAALPLRDTLLHGRLCAQLASSHCEYTLETIEPYVVHTGNLSLGKPVHSDMMFLVVLVLVYHSKPMTKPEQSNKTKML